MLCQTITKSKLYHDGWKVMMPTIFPISQSLLLMNALQWIPNTLWIICSLAMIFFFLLFALSGLIPLSLHSLFSLSFPVIRCEFSPKLIPYSGCKICYHLRKVDWAFQRPTQCYKSFLISTQNEFVSFLFHWSCGTVSTRSQKLLHNNNLNFILFLNARR